LLAIFGTLVSTCIVGEVTWLVLGWLGLGFGWLFQSESLWRTVLKAALVPAPLSLIVQTRWVKAAVQIVTYDRQFMAEC
jgi:hypothetical protein